MRFRTRLKAGVCFLVAMLATNAAAAQVPRPTLAIQKVTVIDVVRGERLAGRTVLVVDGRIAAITSARSMSRPRDAVAVDGRGLFLTPGLVDMHVHLFNNFSHRSPNEWAFPLFLANGVTAVREMRTEPAQLAQVARWRKEVERGERFAPRVLAAGVAADGPTVAAARKRVGEAATAGADFVKVFSEVPAAQWRAIMAEARRVGLPVCGHIPAQIDLLEAARAGQRTNEHLTQVAEACSPNGEKSIAGRQQLPRDAVLNLQETQENEILETFEQARRDRVAAALATTGQVQVPTLVLPAAEAMAKRKRFREDPRWPFLRADEQARWARILEQEKPDLKRAAKRWEISRRIVRTFHHAGVTILAGTDTPMPWVYPGSSLQEELQLLVRCGFSPAEALRAATIDPAKFLGLERDFGSVAVGKRADLLLLAADPLRDIRNLRRIRAVVLAGRFLPGFTGEVPQLR